MHEGKDWENIKSKYDQMRDIYVDCYIHLEMDGELDENFPKFSIWTCCHERIFAKLKKRPKELQKGC